MKKTTLLLLIALFPILLFGQVIPTPEGFSITSSKPTAVTYARKFYITEGENLYMLKHIYDNLTIQVYDIDQNLETSSKEFTNALRKYERIIDVIKSKDSYYILTSNFDKKKKTHALCYRKIDFDSQTIGAVNELRNDNSKKRIINYYSLYFSGDMSKMLVYNKIEDKEMQYKYMVFDSNMELLWSKTYDLPLKGGSTRIKLDDTQVDNLGHVYVAAKIYHANIPPGVSGKLPICHYELLRITESGISNIVLNKKSPNVYDLRLVMSEDNSKYLVGFYNDNKAKFNNHYDGVYAMLISSENKVEYEKSFEFSIDLINQYQTPGKQKKNSSKKSKGKLDYKHLGLQDIIITKDRGLILVSEMYRYNISGSGSSTTYTHIYEDIVVHKIGEDGSLIWVKKLPKDQFGKKSIYLSFKYVKISDKHYFFFLDNIKNKTIEKDIRPVEYKGKKNGIFSAFIIDDDSGEVSKVQFLNKDEAVTEEISEPFVMEHFKFKRLIPITNGILLKSSMGDEKDVIIKIEVLD